MAGLRVTLRSDNRGAWLSPLLLSTFVSSDHVVSCQECFSGTHSPELHQVVGSKSPEELMNYQKAGDRVPREGRRMIGLVGQHLPLHNVVLGVHLS